MRREMEISNIDLIMLRRLVADWLPIKHAYGCAPRPGAEVWCYCGATDHNEAREEARRLLGLEVRDGQAA
jgi:hypothetical protein